MLLPLTVRTWRLLPFVLSFLCAVAQGAAGLTNHESALFQNARPAVVLLYSQDPQFRLPSYQGSGFLIGADGTLVTARHVAESEAELFAVTTDGKIHRVTGFFGEDLDYDVAVVKMDGKDWPHLPLSTGPLPQTNQWVAVISPAPDAGTICSTGTVRSVPALQNLWAVICTTLQIHPGQSGSPMLDAKGEVVGVVSGMDDAQRAAAMPSKIVEEILTNAGPSAPVPFAQRPKSRSLEPLSLNRDFRSATDLIQREDWRAALKKLKRLTSSFPESPMANLLLGLACLKLESWKQANIALGKVTRLKPASGLAWYFYGVSCATVGHYVESEAALKKSIELRFPDEEQLTSAWRLMAETNARQTNMQGIEEALNNLQRLDPSQASNTLRQLRHDFPKLALPAESGHK